MKTAVTVFVKAIHKTTRTIRKRVEKSTGNTFTVFSDDENFSSHHGYHFKLLQRCMKCLD